ncbi:MAG: 5-methylthioadenosine nucleosidase/S-adenosylhomocysteinenucleosidase [Verrucomicrobiota bacterium]
MDVSALGFEPGQTPYEQSVHLSTGIGGLTCSSGDSFVTSANLRIAADLVDMEAYAIAKACIHSSVEFHCYKFVSDRADSASTDDWRANISRGEPLYLEILRQFGLTAD